MRFLISLDNLNAVNGYVIAPRQLAIALRSAGHQAKIFCRVPPKHLLKGEEKDDFLKISIDTFFNQKLISKFKPDVVIANSNYPLDILAIDYAYKNKVLSLYYVHSRIEKLLQSRLFLGEYWPDFLMNSIVKVFKDELKNVDIIVALSEEMHKYVKTLFPNKDIEIISNGINLDQFKYKARSINPNKTINLLYVANFEPRKNQLYLIEVMRNLPNNYKLHLVGGPEDPAYFAKFNNALKKYDRGNIISHGKLGLDSLMPLYEEADVFVNSSKMEAQSLVLMEAIASGLPIVRLHGKDTEGVTKHSITAIHVEDGAEAKKFADEIEALVNNPALYSKINSNQKMEREQFGRNQSCGQLIEVISKRKTDLALKN